MLKSFKKLIIMVLRKEKNKIYSFLSSYKLIIFKNMLVKVLKIYIINIMFRAVEKYKKFFKIK